MQTHLGSKVPLVNAFTRDSKPIPWAMSCDSRNLEPWVTQIPGCSPISVSGGGWQTWAMRESFTSDTERRLWLWTALVVATIYSTLGLARTMSGVLRDRNLLDNAFVFGFGLVFVAWLALALYTRPSVREIGVWAGAAAVFMMLFARLGIPEERTHLFEYVVVGSLIYAALRVRAGNGGGPARPALVAVAVTVAVGTLDEVIQFFLPNRVFDWVDVGFNALAATLAVGTSAALVRLRSSDGGKVPLRTERKRMKEG